MDQMRFVYTPVTGNCSIIARVTLVQNYESWSKAGIMIRETLDDGGANASMVLTPGNGVAWQVRTSDGSGATNFDVAGLYSSCWLEVVRSGNTFTGYRSLDGVNWTQQGSATFTMATKAYVGFAVDSYNCWDLEAATFDNVTAPGWANFTTPQAPASLAASTGNGLVALNWLAVSNATSYNLKRATTSGGPYATVASVTTTNFTDTGVVNGTNYYYVVTAVNPAGESVNSVPASATPQPPQPRIVGISMAGGSLVFGGSIGVANGTYRILSTTNLATPLTNWAQVGSGNFDGSGNCSATNAITPGETGRYFLLCQP